jgi:adenylate cyclase
VSTGMNAFIKIIKTSICILLIGVMGALLCQTKVGSYLEAEIGLDWLFRLRGSLPPPADIIIVSIDQTSAEILHLPEEPEHWSRALYTTLVEKLNQQKPAFIAFNIHFGDNGEPENDLSLAKAMAQNNNVILGGFIKRPAIPAKPQNQEGLDFRLIKSVPELSQAALATAPFLLPKTSSTVKEYWTRFGTDMLTFPASIFQYFVIKQAYPEIKQALNQIDKAAFASLPASFDKFVHESKGIVQDIQTAVIVSSEQVKNFISDANYEPRIKQLLRSWLELLDKKELLYLNHYGDVGTITTVPLYQALTANALGSNALQDKIVLVGYADNLEPDKQQGLYTVFSRVNGNVISPTEIAATAVANLLDHSWLNPLSMRDQTLLILVWGILLSAIFRIFSYQHSMVLTLWSTVVYVVISCYLFKVEFIWLPLAIPMFQVLSIILLQSTGYLLKIRAVSERYLPKEVFAINARYPDAMNQYGILMQGVCMATDAGQYTALSETIDPLQLNRLMNDYYATMFPTIKSRNGLISDVIGDAMLAVWAAEKFGLNLRRDACHAALEIKSAIDGFNNDAEYRLFTRIGLHFGDMRLGNVGAMEHYEYRAVGDTINTATRIEGLNKLLGTCILVSEPVIAGLPDFFTRELGVFLLKGKMQPITVFELMGYDDEIDPKQHQLVSMFANALALYKTHQWQQALYEFRAINQAYHDDSPTRFYINYLQQRIAASSKKARKSSKLDKVSKDNATIIDVGNITSLLH